MDPAAGNVPDVVTRFRADYRAREISARYSGALHFAFTTGLSLAVIGWCAWRLGSSVTIRPVEWLTVPLTFLFANFVEYCGHRGPMHHATRGLTVLHQRHTLQHHRFFTSDAMPAESRRDFKMVLFPPVLLLFFLGGHLVPVGLLLAAVASANVAYLFVTTGVAYYLTYEWLHLAYHLPGGHPIARLPFVAVLRRQHTVHHDPRWMQRCNFNITFPLFDRVYRTRYRDVADPPF